MSMAAGYEKHVRSELALFLRTKRRRVDPGDYGVIASPKRRTSGLRREEVAELAGVGPTWYTWLEQGRDIRPSPRVLQSVASVLRLSKLETDHLFRLAGQEGKPRAMPVDVEPAPSLQLVVDQIRCPAFIRNARYDALVWNAAFAAIFGLERAAPELDRNFLWRLFREDWPALRLPAHEALARYCLADFRLTYANRGMSPSFALLVAELRRISPLFERWWLEYPVEDPREVSQRLIHDVAGELALRFTRFEVSEKSGLYLVLASPEQNGDSEAKIAALVASGGRRGTMGKKPSRPRSSPAGSRREAPPNQ